MTIAFVGNFQPEHSTENDLLWTLQDMGHEVIKFQESTAYTDDILAKAQSMDMFLYVHTHGWVTPGSIPMAEVIRRLNSVKVPTVAFHLDYWYGLERAKDVGADAFWSCKYVFTADGDPKSQEWFKSLGINHYWSKPAVVKRDCYLADPQLIRRSIDTKPERPYDVIFVGSRNYHKEWPYREELLAWLHRTYGERFTHFGGDGVRPVRGAELNQVYADSKVVVGDSLCLGFDHQNYWSDRVYETRGRGGFLIHPMIKGLEDEVLVTYKFADFKELQSKIDHYIRNNGDREHLRLGMYEDVRLNHTYHNRMQAIFETVGLQ